MKSSEKKLLDIFRNLSADHRRTLIAFADFLAIQSNTNADENIVHEPVAIERPENESVIAAIKRLSESFPMLDKAKLLNDTSNLVTQHVVQGKSATEVIDELEVVFRRHYEDYATQQH